MVIIPVLTKYIVFLSTLDSPIDGNWDFFLPRIDF
jgi:hypothetical protein